MDQDIVTRLRGELWLLALGVGLSLCARMIAMVALTHGVDDLVYWGIARFDFQNLARLAVPEGRFMFPFVAWASDALGVNLPRAFTLSGLSLSLSLAVCGVVICRIWRIEGNKLLSAAVVGLFVVHPYFTDIFLWKTSMFTGGLPFALSLIAMLVARSSWRNTALGAILFVVALGIHQLPITVCAAVIAFAALFDLIRAEGGRTDDRRLIAENLRLLAMLGGGTLLYVIVAKLIGYVAGFPSPLGREELILLSDPILVVMRAGELLRVIVLADPLIAPVPRVMLASMLALAIAQTAFKAIQGRRVRLVGVAIGLPIVVFVALICATAMVIAPFPWVPAFRSISAVSVTWAGIATAAYLTGSTSARRVVLVATAVILFAFIGKSNEMLSDQMRASERDRSLMARIAVDVERLTPLAEISYIVFVGSNTTPLTGLSTAIDVSGGWGPYGTTVSVFAAWFGENTYLSRLFAEVTGYKISVNVQQPHLNVARELCSRSPAWPVVGSVVHQDNLAIVCLSAPMEKIASPFAASSD